MTQIEGFAVKHSNEAATVRVVDVGPRGNAVLEVEIRVSTQKHVCVCMCVFTLVYSKICIIQTQTDCKRLEGSCRMC